MNLIAKIKIQTSSCAVVSSSFVQWGMKFEYGKGRRASMSCLAYIILLGCF